MFFFSRAITQLLTVHSPFAPTRDGIGETVGVPFCLLSCIICFYSSGLLRTKRFRLSRIVGTRKFPLDLDIPSQNAYWHVPFPFQRFLSARVGIPSGFRQNDQPHVRPDVNSIGNTFMFRWTSAKINVRFASFQRFHRYYELMLVCSLLSGPDSGHRLIILCWHRSPFLPSPAVACLCVSTFSFSTYHTIS